MSGGKHCYPESDVLINKYNIRDKELLERLEIQKVAMKLLGLDANPNRISCTGDIDHLVNVHKYLFGEIYEWAGQFRKENLYKSERVLSGGSAEYTNYKEIHRKLEVLFDKYQTFQWTAESDLTTPVCEFLLELWSIHPFREGNTRTCVTFMWHFLKGKGVEFRVELLRNNPMYVRDSFVMANYDQKEYLEKILADALTGMKISEMHMNGENKTREEYQIAKADYEAFKEKYSIKAD